MNRGRVAFVIGVLALGSAVGLLSPRACDARVERSGIEPDATTIDVPEAAAPTLPTRGAPDIALEVEPEGLLFAKRFWGPKWPDVEADLVSRGKQPRWSSAPTVSWEEASKEFGEKLFPLGQGQRDELIAGNLMQWHGQADAEWLRQTIGWEQEMPVDLVPRVVELVERHNGRIEPLAKEWAERLDFEIRAAWRAGRYEYGPFTLPRGKPGAYIWSSAQGHGGWTARMVLTFDDCPGLADLLKEIRSLVAARNLEVRKLLGATR